MAKKVHFNVYFKLKKINRQNIYIYMNAFSDTYPKRNAMHLNYTFYQFMHFHENWTHASLFVLQ